MTLSIVPVNRRFTAGLIVIILIGLVLRLKGIHNPVLDHPGWRQGDTAAIARNFATLDYNPVHPQADYDGPPPNYVELELQIVPFLAATLYKIFGVHEIFGRLISIAFSLGTIAVIGFFARYAFRNDAAALAAALAFALFPGSVYYGRTFMPDTTMTFFLTAAIYASVRWIRDDDTRTEWHFWTAAVLMALAILAKPVAIVGLIPIYVALWIKRDHFLDVVYFLPTYGFLAVALAPYVAYDAYLHGIAEWHWSSGITTLHVIPGLKAAFASRHGFALKLTTWRDVLGMLPGTMLGVVGTTLAVLGAFAIPRGPARAALWGWLLGALAYAFAVVTVERVDYYLYLFLPPAALFVGGLVARLASTRALSRVARPIWILAAAACAIAAYVTGERAIRPYYAYSKIVYRQALALNKTLVPGTLIVMGHYDPSILYYIGHKGWEEDPYLWTPFDEESAIAKGAKYFVAIENNRLERNVELSNWLVRFPVKNPQATWPVYETDPQKQLPGSEARWQTFRRNERAGTLSPAKARGS